MDYQRGDEYAGVKPSELRKAEETAREALKTLTGSWEGWPVTEADWAFLRSQARTLHHACDLRAGLLVIEEQ